MSNLILTRRTGETILVGDDIEITLLDISVNHARISIRAPQDVRIVRAELKPRDAVVPTATQHTAVIRRKRRFP